MLCSDKCRKMLTILSSHNIRDDASSLFQRSSLHGSVGDPVPISLKSPITTQHPILKQERSALDGTQAQASTTNSLLIKGEIRLAEEARKEIKAYKRVAWLPGSFKDLVTIYGADFVDPSIE
jgi:hypothetical protein